MLKKRSLLPIVVLVLAGVIGVVFLETGPEPKRKPPKATILSVETTTVKPQAFPVWVQSQGVMAPLVRSALTSEVAGRLLKVSPRFVRGAFIVEGELLAQIDPEPYRLQAANLAGALETVEARLAELAISHSNLQKSLIIETDMVNLASRQFQRVSSLHKKGTVAQSRLEQDESELLLRRTAKQKLTNSLNLIPAQRKTLEAERKLKQAQRDTALLDLEKTRIVAPFPGRVVAKNSDLGQFVSKGAVLGEIYATKDWEVRLPVTDSQLALLDLSNLEGEFQDSGNGPEVKLSAGQGAAKRSWSGEIIRTEAVVDSRTRQTVLVARINNRQGDKPDPDLLEGRFVEAAIAGRTLDNVFVLPRHIVGPGDLVLVIDKENRLQRRKVVVAWRNQQSAAINSGLQTGEVLSITPLPFAPNGAKVTIKGSGTQTAGNKKPDRPESGRR